MVDTFQPLQLRTAINRLQSPSDPLAPWKARLDEWIDINGHFRQMESELFHGSKKPSETALRQHRMIVHGLVSIGEGLAVELISTSGVPTREKNRQMEYIDTFLDSLRVTLVAFHRPHENDRKGATLAKYF